MNRLLEVSRSGYYKWERLKQYGIVVKISVRDSSTSSTGKFMKSGKILTKSKVPQGLLQNSLRMGSM